MTRAALLALVALAPLPAAALSCMPYEPTDAFVDADASAARYVVVSGQLESLGGMPANELGKPYAFAARVKGHSLTRQGFTTPFEGPVTVEVTCTAGWCGQLEPGGAFVMFLETSGPGHVLTMAPCKPMAFANPTPGLEETLRRCFAGGACVPDSL